MAESPDEQRQAEATEAEPESTAETSDDGDGDTEAPSRRRHWLVRLTLLLVVLELLYLLAANVFLHRSFGPSVIARNPEKLQITWSSAWTVVPGLVRVRGVDVRGRTPKVHWRLAADGAWLWVSLPDLARRRFTCRWLLASELEHQLRFAERSAAGQPVIEGFDGLPEPVRQARQNPWRVDFENVSVDGIRELWLGPLRYVADDASVAASTASGSVLTQVHGPVSVPRAEVTLGPGDTGAGGESLGRVRRVAFRGSVDPFVPHDTQNVERLGFVSGRLEISAVEGSLGLVDYFFRGAPASANAKGDLEALVLLDHGLLLDGTSLRIEQGEVRGAYLGFHGSGVGNVRGAVEGGIATLDVEVAEADIGYQGVDGTLLQSRDIRISGTSDQPDLSRKVPQLTLVAELPRSWADDLSRFASFLPSNVPVQLVGGRGTVSGRATVWSRAAEDDPGRVVDGMTARLLLEADQVQVTALGDAVTADVELEVVAPAGSLSQRRLVLDGTRLQLENVRSGRDDKPWWADVRVASGAVLLPEGGTALEGSVRADVEARFADSRPLVALAAHKHNSLRWFDRLLTFDDIEVTGKVRTVGGNLEVAELWTRDAGGRPGEGRDLQILGELEFHERGYDALLYASMKVSLARFAAAVRLDDSRLDAIDLRHSLEWYRRQQKDFWTER